MLSVSQGFYSPEAISFQSTAFRDSLISLFEKYRTDQTPVMVTELETAISDSIKDYTNINVDTRIGNYQMSIEVPQIDKNSPMLEGYGFSDIVSSKRTLSDIRKSKNGSVTGMIDPQTSRVGGYLADLPAVRMFLNQFMIYGMKGTGNDIFDANKYTSGELAATIIHEVGHVWTFMEFLVRYRTDNQILAATARELDGTTDSGKRELIIKDAGDALGVKSIDAQDLSHKNNTTVYTVLVTNVARFNRSQSGSRGYDINSFEAMADQFAGRHGCGRDLVTGLDKMSKGSIHRRGWTSYMFFEFSKIAMGLAGVAAIATGVTPIAMGVAFVLTTLILADSHNEWYDKTGYRFRRIRNDLIEMLKDPGVSKEESARIRYDIDEIDEINKKYKDHTQLIGLVYDYLIPSGISKRKDIEFQQVLESMSANQMFYYANRLKNI